MSAVLSALVIYPIKSCAGQEQASGEVQPRGLKGDRRWMLVDENGDFLTGRQWPALVRVAARISAEGSLTLAAPAMQELAVPVPDSAVRCNAQIWGDQVNAADAGDAAADWFSRYLQRPARLMYADEQMHRGLDPDYSQAGDELAFADGYPQLLLSRAATDQLSVRAGRELGWRRFRPNLLIDGVPAHAEDGWRRIRIGEVLFDVVKPCVRCVFPTIDPDSGIAEADGEPLRTLKSYRGSAKGITFGQNLIARSAGVVHCGDRVEIIE